MIPSQIEKIAGPQQRDWVLLWHYPPRFPADPVPEPVRYWSYHPVKGRV